MVPDGHRDEAHDLDALEQPACARLRLRRRGRRFGRRALEQRLAEDHGRHGDRAAYAERRDELAEPMFFLTFFYLLATFWQTLRGPFSAVSTPNFASKYSFESP